MFLLSFIYLLNNLMTILASTIINHQSVGWPPVLNWSWLPTPTLSEGDWRKAWKISFTIAGVKADIWRRDLPICFHVLFIVFMNSSEKHKYDVGM